MSRPRVAWFSPVPPARSGIAAYTADVVPLLVSDVLIDVFVDGRSLPAHGEAPEAGSVGISGATTRRAVSLNGAAVLDAHEFAVRHSLHPYDLVVYQVGNAHWHDYIWPYALRYPGLVVLHDAVLHHARARTLLDQGRRADYRREFAYAHPDAPAALAEFAIAGFSGSPYYLWPMTRVLVEAARLVVVHSEQLADRLRAEYPGRPIRAIRMGVPAAEGERAGPGRPRSGPVFACFGRITPEKRIPQVLRAFASLCPEWPRAELLLVGEVADYYAVEADAREVGVVDRTTIAGFVADEDVDSWLMRADVCVCLRWPTARETSASWLRALAAGKATVITDLAHTTNVPVLDPRSWTLAHTRADARAAQAPPAPSDAVAVAIDILDEDHSLGLALGRLARDAALRAQLGDRARAWWAGHHTLPVMAADYHEAIADALARPAHVATTGWPPHLRDDGGAMARGILSAFEVGLDVL
jgi:glycosyltransferase involved in cell wall biosynthesis